MVQPSSSPFFRVSAYLSLSSMLLAGAPNSALAQVESENRETPTTAAPAEPKAPNKPVPENPSAESVSPGPEVAAQGPTAPEPPPAKGFQSAPADAIYPKQTGLGGLIAGSILTGIGIPTLTVGAVVMKKALKEQAIEDTDTIEAAADEAIEATESTLELAGGGLLVTVGAALTLVGIPLLAVGASRYGQYQDWKRRHRASLTPRIDLDGRGFGIGYRLSF